MHAWQERWWAPAPTHRPGRAWQVGRGSPRSPIWMSGSPPTKSFLSKHTPGCQAGQATPLPADRRKCGPHHSLCQPSMETELRPLLGAMQSGAPGLAPVPELSSLLTTATAHLWAFLYWQLSGHRRDLCFLQGMCTIRNAAYAHRFSYPSCTPWEVLLPGCSNLCINHRREQWSKDTF